MNRYSLASAALVAVSSLALVQGALADSRLFSARTDQPDVTVDEAYVEGQPLAIAGKGGGVTFFRIDNPAGAIPCTGNFSFVKSNGERTETELDLCAANWEVTVNVRGAADAPTPEPTPPPGALRTVTITTDDPGIGIGEVFLERNPVEITGREGNSVEIGVPPGPGGIQCQRDLGVRLTDGRTIARSANICANNWSVLVMLAEDLEPTPPAVIAAAPPAPLLAPPPLPPPLVDPTATWSFAAAPGNVTLIHGVPETDDAEFFANCRPGSGQGAIAIARTVPGLRQGLPIPVTLSAGAFTRTYNAVGSPFSEMSGGSNPQFTIPTTDALWGALIAEAQLIVGAGSTPPYVLSLRGSSTPTRQFLAACSPAPVVFTPPVVVAPAPLPPGIRYLCRDGSPVNVFFNRFDRTALVTEPGLVPQMLPLVPGPPGASVWAAGPFRLVGRGAEIRWWRPNRPPRICFPG